MGRMARNGQDPPPQIAGRYRLVEKLGTGGMSVVWRGYDETLGRSVAVKVLSPRLADDQSFRDRLRQEALAAARLSHPHITGIFDFGESPLSEHLTVPYVVMELNDGESVAARLGRQGALSWREAVTIATEVASALATAHARGVVHRDVTPANVMLTGAGAKVVDFGISAIVGQRDAAPDGSLLGTPAYLAPERLAGAQVSAATDVYALGLLLYRTLTGRLPWPAETTAEALRAHLYADPDPLPALPGMPPEVAALCLRCLAKSPADRPAAASMARDLAATAGLQPIIPPLRERLDDAPPPVRGSAAASLPAEPPVSWGRAALAYLGLCAPAPEVVTGSVPLSARVSPECTSPDVTAGNPPGVPNLATVPCVAPAPDAGRSAVSLRVLRLRTGLKIGGLLRLGGVRRLGGGLFAGGGVAMLTGRRRHRLQAVLLTAALLAAAGVGWAATREAPEVEQAQAAGAGPAAGVPASTTCAVRYQLQRDSGSRYEALLTVATTEEVGRSPWRVQFSYPGSQRLTKAPKAVTQKGRKVVAKGSGKLRSFALRGAYRGYNPLPFLFTLDGRRCRAEILGTVRGDAESISQAAGPGKKRPNRGAGESKRNRPPRKTVRPSLAPAPTPAARKGSGFTLAL